MRATRTLNRITVPGIFAWLIPIILFWGVLAFHIPPSLTQSFHRFSPLVFLVILFSYYLTFQIKGALGVLTGFGLTMILFALSLSYVWTSGFSDNFLIGGLLPYKDAKNYYLGANLLLHGLPIRVAGQAVGRPLFPGFLSSLLLLTGQNLKAALAVLTQLAGIGVYLSARPVRRSTGALGGALYLGFMYYYFQRHAGYTMSESLGFIGGCFGFVLLWRAAQDRKWFDLLLGLGVLLVAVSARAGAFLIFPLLALWAGRIFGGEKRTSLILAIGVLAILAAGFLIANAVYPRLVGVPEGSSFGNFAYTIYGQVRGGIGWHSAIDELGTRNSSRVYQAAWDNFLDNPSGFGRGILNAYADFFLPRAGTVYPFEEDISSGILWVLATGLLLRGLYLVIFKHRSDILLFLLAGWIGIVLSIPFLPPVDGGNRFYASTMPFFFAMLAVGTSRSGHDEIPAADNGDVYFLRGFGISLLALTVLLPPVTLRASSLPALDAPVCSPEQRPFAINLHPGSYIDLIQEGKGSCGLVPTICFADFRQRNTELQIDDFYQQLDTLAASSGSGIRIIPTLNLLDGYFQYFVATDPGLFENSTRKTVSGCATRILTENQRIFLIESVSSSAEQTGYDVNRLIRYNR